MNTNSIDPKRFSLKIETIAASDSATEVTPFSLKDLMKSIEQVITRHYMADGSQQIALSIQAYDQTFDRKESIINLTDISSPIALNSNDYTRQHWIEAL
jgi:c-di-AMP phosphodiesterase-like protein